MSYQRTKNSLLGLAAGDAISWQAMYHRSNELPFWTRRLRREIDAESEDAGIIRPNLPFSLNNPADAFKFSCTDDAEWAAFTALKLIENNGVYDYQSHLKAWNELAGSEDKITGSVAIIAALENIRKGKVPPVTGNDNPHFFDDSAMMRAVPIGALYAGRPQKASEYTALEASVTNAYDGVWAAQAMSAAVSTACAGNEIDSIISAAVAQLPENSWIRLKVTEALAIASKCDSVFQALPLLNDEIIEHSYNYGTTAVDNLALTLSIFRLVKATLTDGILAAASLAKTADSVPAFVGALCGAVNDSEIPPSWTDSLTSLRGICIPSLKGKRYLNIASELNSMVQADYQIKI
ncbi:MAG: ADP-ribosylglycohydrolase family protein [Bacteroidota bacterium]